MADDNTKELQKLNKEQAQTNKQLTSVQSSLNAMATALGAPPTSDPEEKKETKAANKAVLDTLKGILKATQVKAGEVGGGMLAGIKKMFTKYKKIIMSLLGVGLVAMFSQLDMKQVKAAWTAFKDAMHKVWEVLKPLGKAIKEWVTDNFLPNTVALLIAQFKIVGQLFDDVKAHFEGWEGKDWQEKVKAVIGSFGKLGTALANAAINVGDWALQLLGYDGKFSKDVKAKWEATFGETKEGGILSTVGGMFKSIGGLFLLGSVIGGKTGALLQAPIKLAILGGKKAVGLIPSLAKGITKALPAMGKASKFAGQLLGKVGLKGFGILGLAYSVGEGAFAAYKAYEKGGTVDEVWQAGISKFLTSVTLGIMSEKTANSWAKGITGFFGSVYDAMFGDKQKELTEKEIQEQRELRSGKKWNDMTPEQKRAEEARLRSEQTKRRRGGAASAVAKGDLVGIGAEIQSVYDEMDAANRRKENVPGERKQTLTKLKARLDQLKADEAAIYEAQQPKGIANVPAGAVTPAQVAGGPKGGGKIDWGFISDKEGGSKLEGYVPNPKGSKSGVTIATGFDLGARNKKDLEGLSPALRKKLNPYLGFQGKDAARLLGMAPLKITADEAKEIDQMSKGASTAKLKNEWNARAKKMGGQMFEDLSGAQKTVVASVGFQYGSLSKAPRFRNAAMSGNWSGAAHELDNFGDAYGSRRHSEAMYLRNDSGFRLASLQGAGGAGGAGGGSSNVSVTNINKGGTNATYAVTNDSHDTHKKVEETISVET